MHYSPPPLLGLLAPTKQQAEHLVGQMPCSWLLKACVDQFRALTGLKEASIQLTYWPIALLVLALAIRAGGGDCIIYAVLLSYGEVTERFVMALDALHTLIYVSTKRYFFYSVATLVTLYALSTLVISRFLASLLSLRKRPTFNSPGSFGYINSVVPHCVAQSLYTVI